MKKICILFSLLVLGLTSIQAQKFFTREGKISFFSEAPMEKIEAHTNTANSVIDLESGRMEFAVLIKSFHFEKALMQEHFNENYMESDKFPKAIFKGQITNIADVKNLTVDGTYEVQVTGDLTIHGVTQEVSTTASMTRKGDEINGTAKFIVLVADYDIEIPAVVRDNIAKEVEILVDCSYQEFKAGS